MSETTISKDTTLTPKQEKFVLNVVNGMSQRQAYLAAYPKSKKWKDKTIDNKASELFNKKEVLGRYHELLKKAEDEAIMSAAERKIWLSKIVKSGLINVDGTDVPIKSDARLKAMDILNKMSGEYITKIETTDEGFNINIQIGNEKNS